MSVSSARKAFVSLTVSSLACRLKLTGTCGLFSPCICQVHRAATERVYACAHCIGVAHIDGHSRGVDSDLSRAQIAVPYHRVGFGALSPCVPAPASINQSINQSINVVFNGVLLLLLQEENEDYQQVKDAFFKTLERAGESALSEKTHILLIVDAINQLNPFYNAQTMDWFPTYLYVACQSIVVWLFDCLVVRLLDCLAHVFLLTLAVFAVQCADPLESVRFCRPRQTPFASLQ
jgi:hypothetical protein